MFASLQYPKKIMMKQQEGSPNSTTVGKSFEKNCILHGYYFVFTMKAQFVKIYEFSLPSPYMASFQAFRSQCTVSVTYPRRTARRHLDNLGVHMHEHFCIFEKFTHSTEIICK